MIENDRMGQSFPELTEAEWDKLCRSNMERVLRRQLSDEEWARQRKYNERMNCEGTQKLDD